MLTPIETQYRGHRFRSRLEARWAVFFDALGAEWKYEDEGYTLSNGERYLPDFWLPQMSIFAEIKGKEFTDAERERCRLLALDSGFSVMMLDGLPQERMYPMYVGGSAVIEQRMFASEEYRIDLAYEAATFARFEYGEAGLPVIPVPISRIRRSGRQARSSSAEREILRAILDNRNRTERVAERISPSSFRDERFRAVFEALLITPDTGDVLKDIAPLLDAGSLEIAESLFEDRGGLVDPDRTLEESLLQLEVREMEDRVAEIDRLLPKVSSTERETLEAERAKIIVQVRASGRSSFKAYRRRTR